MKLTKLLACINKTISTQYSDIDIVDVQTDSRKISPGALFMAVAGETVDGSEYINQAITNGAIAVLITATAAHINDHEISKVPIICVADLSTKVGLIASSFYADPSKLLNIVGVTGTNGKSSTCHYIAEILRNLSHPAATIGTLGVGTASGYQETQNTTPGAVELQKILADLQKDNISTVAMEVSSHALVQNRVNGVCFNTAVFTNLTQDHLDYHKNMAEYWQAKLKLFTEHAPKNVVVNLDDTYGKQLLPLLDASINVIGYSMQAQTGVTKNILIATDVKYTANGTLTKLNGSFGSKTLEIQLIGNFNLSNMLAAIASCLALGFEFNAIVQVAAKVRSIPGRMQYIRVQEQPLVVVDYAHTPDALSRVLLTLRHYCAGKLWCVFGCGGDRDRLKRSQMFTAAKDFSDYVIITQDNPRTEDPQQIIADILENHPQDPNIIIELDRRAAIELAISKATMLDVVLIAGKGHENYQIIGTQYLPFSDVSVVEDYMHNKSCIT